MKDAEKFIKYTELVLTVGELLDEQTKDLDAQEAFEIAANVCMRLTSYPMLYIDREAHKPFINNFLVGARGIMEEYSATEQETGH